METGSVSDLVALLGKEDALVGDFLFEVLDGRDVLVDDRLVDQRPQGFDRLQLGCVGRQKKNEASASGIFSPAEKFGREFSNRICRCAPVRGDKWHLDEIVITIARKKHWLWRAVVRDGFVLDILVQSGRDRAAAQRLMRKLLKKSARAPRVVITDKPKSYGAAHKDMGLHMEHREHKGQNNRAENSHQPTRRRELIMKRFKSPRQIQKFLLIHDKVANLFYIPLREKMSAPDCRACRDQAFAARTEITSARLAT